MSELKQFVVVYENEDDIDNKINEIVNKNDIEKSFNIMATFDNYDDAFEKTKINSERDREFCDKNMIDRTNKYYIIDINDIGNNDMGIEGF